MAMAVTMVTLPFGPTLHMENSPKHQPKNPKALQCHRLHTKMPKYEAPKTNGDRRVPKVLRKLCKQGKLMEALQSLAETEHQKPVDPFGYTFLLQECIRKEAYLQGKLIHSYLSKIGFVLDTVLANTLLNMYAKIGDLKDARQLFDGMPQRDGCSWNVMIAAYSRHGYAEEALALFHNMQKEDISPNRFTYSSVLSACAKLGALEHGTEIHNQIIRSGCQTDVFLDCALVELYVKCGQVDKASELFDKMPQRNVVSCNIMIAAYGQNGRVDEARRLFNDMPKDVISWNAMITGLIQNGHVEEAQKLFSRMPGRNVVSWTAMIAGYVQNGCSEDALKCFLHMRRAGVRPDNQAFASALTACSNLAALQQGMEIHKEIVRSGSQSDVFLANALMDMYAKCGSINKARHVFDKMTERNVVTWTTTIGGYAMHGQGMEALRLFEEMQVSGTSPNHVTLLCVLMACCHSGLVEIGQQFFNRMSGCYKLAPTMEHYGCMVDLYGRAGRLDIARDFIDKMPIKPDATVWGCLLGACSVHNDLELGKFAAEQLLVLEPDNATSYVVLSNIYATAGMWKDYENVRRMMENTMIKKLPGCSWIEVNNQVHSFSAGDRSHPQTEKMHAELDRLLMEMKTAGYVPNTRSVLLSVER